MLGINLAVLEMRGEYDYPFHAELCEKYGGLELSRAVPVECLLFFGEMKCNARTKKKHANSMDNIFCMILRDP